MNRFVAIALAAGIALGAASPADAQRCGRGWHHQRLGHCRGDFARTGYGRGYRPGPPVLIVDRFYPGRGYWDGRRYWQHREHRHDGWRYR